MNIASPVPSEKRLPAAPRIFVPELSGQLPCRLSSLSPRARAHIGALLDDGRVRYLLDTDGAPIVAWRRL
jgi:hypothetical protein